MAKSKLCPACKHPLDPEKEGCPNCPWSSRLENEEDPHEAQRRGFSSYFWFVAVAVIAFGLWAFWEGLMKVGEANMKDESKMSVDQKSEQELREELMKVTKRDYSKNRVDTDILPTAAPSEENSPPPEPGPDSTAVGPDSAREARDAAEWRLRGTVYDLVTLKPLGHCTMLFKDAENGKSFETSSAADGRYRVIVPSMQGRGYSVVIHKAGYAASYLNPGTENVGKMSDEDRRSLAGDLGKSLDGPYEVQAYGGAPLTTDFYLAPLR